MYAHAQPDSARRDAKGPRRAYDILHDSFGVLRCPNCGFRGGAAEFRKAATPPLQG